jgi:D-glycero-D-manno-heptose 1,7-bisphosphate phosphatase
MGKPAFFLDRDGVINPLVAKSNLDQMLDSPSSTAEFNLFPGVSQALKRINQSGFLAVVVSNQPGPAKRKFSYETLREITNKMMDLLATDGAYLDAVYYCLHHPLASVSKYRRSCNCRKPKPGLLLQAAKNLDIDFHQSIMVGDSLTDIKAGKKVECKTILIGNGDRKTAVKQLDCQPDWIAGSLLEAVDFIFKQGGSNENIYRFSQRQ